MLFPQALCVLAAEPHVFYSSAEISQLVVHPTLHDLASKALNRYTRDNHFKGLYSEQLKSTPYQWRKTYGRHADYFGVCYKIAPNKHKVIAVTGAFWKLYSGSNSQQMALLFCAIISSFRSEQVVCSQDFLERLQGLKLSLDQKATFEKRLERFCLSLNLNSSPKENFYIGRAWQSLLTAELKLALIRYLFCSNEQPGFNVNLYIKRMVSNLVFSSAYRRYCNKRNFTSYLTIHSRSNNRRTESKSAAIPVTSTTTRPSRRRKRIMLWVIAASVAASCFLFYHSSKEPTSTELYAEKDVWIVPSIGFPLEP